MAALLSYGKLILQQLFRNNIWRSRLVGRGRATGNRVTAKNGSRVRISSSPCYKNRQILCQMRLRFADFALTYMRKCTNNLYYRSEHFRALLLKCVTKKLNVSIFGVL